MNVTKTIAVYRCGNEVESFDHIPSDCPDCGERMERSWDQSVEVEYTTWPPLEAI